MYKTHTYDWFQSYPEAQEALPHNMPEPRGQLVKLWGYFDASHARCLKTQQLVSGILTLHEQLPNPLVLQTPEHSGNFNVWIRTHCLKDSSGVHYQFQVKTAHAGSSSQRILSIIWRQPVYDHEHYSSRFHS